MSTRFGLKLFWVFCGFANAAPWASAQTQNSGSGQTAPAAAIKTSVSFLLVANAPALPEAYYESGPNRVRVHVTADALAKSAPIFYEGPSTLVLYSAPSTGGGSTGAPLTRVELPKVPQSLVLLAPGSNASVGKGLPQYVALAVPDDWDGFSAGMVRVLNFSGKRAQVKIAGQAVPAEKGAGRPTKVAEPGKGEVNFPFELMTAEADGPFLAYKNSMKIRPNQRLTVIALPRSAEGGRGVSIVVTRENSPVPVVPGSKSVGEKH